MRILNWVQNKLTARQEKKRFDAGSSSARFSCAPEDRKEEFSDWPQALLAIGTFGNNKEELKEDQQRHEPSPSEDLRPSQDVPDFTLEEVRKLQKELTKLLSRKSKSGNKGSEMDQEDETRANLPLNRFLNCPSSLEVDRTASLKISDDGDLSPDTRIVLNKAKDLLLSENGNGNAIKKKSLSFLLKKMFVCTSGFAPPLNLRDPIPESRMEKILRTILSKKIYPRRSAPTSTKKLSEKKPTQKMLLGNKEEEEEKGDDRCKWVKTDSEYIVLEI